jgi:hypothetical protein
MSPQMSLLKSGGLVLATLLALLATSGTGTAADIAGTRALIERGFDAPYPRIDAMSLALLDVLQKK